MALRQVSNFYVDELVSWADTKQQVLELIERLGVGTALPSERQLSADLGVSRLTVRAALDDLARSALAPAS